MIVAAAFLPQSPLLLRNIGKEQSEKVNQTIAACESVARDILAAKPDTIVCVSSGPVYANAFSGNLHDPFVGEFTEFGDFSTRFVVRPDLETADRLKRHLRGSSVPFTLDSTEKLDSNIAVPLSFFGPALSSIRILPLMHGLQSHKEHFQFGVTASEVFHATNRRIALLGAGDLSHRLTSDAPGGFAPEGTQYDAKVQELLGTGSVSGLIAMDRTNIEAAGENAHYPLLMLLGMIDALPETTRIVSYEAPFGVGLLTATFSLR